MFLCEFLSLCVEWNDNLVSPISPSPFFLEHLTGLSVFCANRSGAGTPPAVLHVHWPDERQESLSWPLSGWATGLSLEEGRVQSGKEREHTLLRVAVESSQQFMKCWMFPPVPSALWLPARPGGSCQRLPCQARKGFWVLLPLGGLRSQREGFQC